MNFPVLDEPWAAAVSELEALQPGDWGDDFTPTAQTKAEVRSIAGALCGKLRAPDEWTLDGSLEPADVTLAWSKGDGRGFFAVVIRGLGQVTVVGNAGDGRMSIAERVATSNTDEIIRLALLPEIQPMTASPAPSRPEE